jgi:hypothetical protein
MYYLYINLQENNMNNIAHIVAEHYLSADGEMFLSFCDADTVALISSIAGYDNNPNTTIAATSELGQKLITFFPNAEVITLEMLVNAGYDAKESSDSEENIESISDVMAQECLTDDNPGSTEFNLMVEVARLTKSTRYLAG